MPAEKYHAMHEYLSNSMLGHFIVSPAHRQADLRHPLTATPAMVFGSLTHTCVLAPQGLDRQYVVAPPFDRRTKDGKAAADAFETANDGRKSIDQETHVQVDGFIRSV